MNLIDKNQIWETLNKILFSDPYIWRQSVKEIPLLAHYTSIDVLEKMMKSDEIWFSNPLYMNDREEVSLGIELGISLVKESKAIKKACQTENRLSEFCKLFESYNSKYMDYDILDTYVFCVSEHHKEETDGRLSMWRGYGNNGKGVSIVFDPAQIGDTKGVPLFIFAKIHYGSKDCFTNILNSIIEKCANYLENSNLQTDMLYLAAAALFNRIKVFALCAKHNGFIEEKEWRVIHIKDHFIYKDDVFKDMYSYHLTHRGIEPKLKFKVAPIPNRTSNDLSLCKIINKIILGPTYSLPLSLSMIKRVLDINNKGSLEICSSKIPFRTIGKM